MEFIFMVMSILVKFQIQKILMIQMVNLWLGSFKVLMEMEK